MLFRGSQKCARLLSAQNAKPAPVGALDGGLGMSTFSSARRVSAIFDAMEVWSSTP